MDFIFKESEKFKIFWKKFVNENNNATWSYLPNLIAYQKFYSGKIEKDLSFVIVQSNNILAICPLFLELYGNNKTFTNSGEYLRSPIIKSDLNIKYKNKIEKECFNKIDELAKKYNVKKTMFLLDPLPENHKYNYLMKYGYLDTSINTSIMDLTKNKEEMWSSLRNSYKSLINNGKKKYEVIIVDAEKTDYKAHNLYKELHHKTAGRITRCQETWDLQYEMLKDDNAMLIGLKDFDMFVAFSYFSHHNGKACYGSSSDDPDYKTDIPLEHTIIWSAIEYYKKRNFKLLEIGWQSFGKQIFDHPSQKYINLSFFKRGFGGEIRTLYRGIKYYDKEFMKKDLEQNISKLIKETK